MRRLILSPNDPLPDLSNASTLIADTETSGTNRHLGARICGIAIGTHDGAENYYVPIRHLQNNVSLDRVLPWMQSLLSEPDRTWIMHNGKFDLAMLRADGLELKGRLLDTMILAYVHESSRFSYALDTLTRLYCPEFKHAEYEKVAAYILQTQKVNIKGRGEDRKLVNFALVPTEILGPYALEDLEATRQLAQILREQKFGVARDNYGCISWDTCDLAKLEMELVPVLMDIEDRGVLIDVKKALRLRDTALDQYEEHMRTMCRCAHGAVDPLSWKSHWDGFARAGGEVTAWTLKKEVRGKQKGMQFTADKAQSTNRPNWNAVALLTYLKKYRDENPNVYQYLIAYREAMLLNRINSTYIESYLEKIDGNNILHGQFSQTGTVTGRLASSKPNLQNLSVIGGTADQKAFEKFTGVKDEDAVNRQIRSLFIAEPGHVLLAIDYSQVEYRMAVWYAQDKTMIDVWKADPTVDYHLATQELLGVDRACAKTLNFGTLYGLGSNGLAANLTASGSPTTKTQAQEILNLLFAKRPSLRQLIQSVSNTASQKGWVLNIFGRYVSVPRDGAYKGLNYLVQGSCGDLMRLALVRLHRLINEKGWPVKMLLTVHDEVVFSMAPSLVAEIAPQLAACMCTCEFIGMPLLSDIEVGDNWGQMLALKDWLAEQKKSETLSLHSGAKTGLSRAS